MSVPLTAPNRMDILYTVNNILHKWRGYFELVTYLGGNYVKDREATIPTLLWNDAAAHLWDVVRANYPVAVGAPVAQRWTRSGDVWTMDEEIALIATGTALTPHNPAQQTTWILRDTSNKFIRFMFLETSNGYIGHYRNGITGSGALDGVTNALNGVSANTYDAYRWLKSRGNRFLAATGTVAGLTMDLNDKLKRRRGLE